MMLRLSWASLAGVDPTDAITQESAGRFETDYTQFLEVGSLVGARIGIGRDFLGSDPETIRIFDEAMVMLERLGAVIVDPVRFPDYVHAMKEPIFPLIRNAEFKAQIADYFETLRPGSPRTVDELTARANAPGSCYLDSSPEKAFALQYTAAYALDLDDPVYLAAVNDGIALVKSGTEAVFANYALDAIVYPTVARPASLIRTEDAAAARAALAEGRTALLAALSEGSKQTQAGRSRATGNESALLIASYSGYPELVVPAGTNSDGLPITISFMGQAYSEPKLLSYGYDFEQATRARVLPKNTPVLPGELIAR